MGRGRRTGNHRPVAAKDGQIEVTLSDADHPHTNRGARYAVIASDLRQRDPPGHIGHCTEDIAYVVGLAGQDVTGKNPLPAFTLPATRNPHSELPVARTATQAAPHPGVGQVQVRTAAFATDAARKNIV
jgi:hypothetical protein